MTDLNSMNATEIYEQNIAEHFGAGSIYFNDFTKAFEIHCEDFEQKEALWRFTSSTRNNSHLLLLKHCSSGSEKTWKLEFRYISIIEACHDYPSAAERLEKICRERDEECFELIHKDASPCTLPENGVYLLSNTDDLMSIIIVGHEKITVNVIEEG